MLKKLILKLRYRKQVKQGYGLLHEVGQEIDLTPIDGRCFIGRHKFRNGQDRCMRCNALRTDNV